MADSVVVAVASRYASLDFKGIPGFPNPLHDNKECLERCPKFNGNDLSKAERHLSDFQYFVDCLEIVHEDVYMRMFYDSLEGNCRIWVKSFPPKFIDSITSFWDLFLKTWAEKTNLWQIMFFLYLSF
jgi:hypothetical protein